MRLKGFGGQARIFFRERFSALAKIVSPKNPKPARCFPLSKVILVEIVSFQKPKPRKP